MTVEGGVFEKRERERESTGSEGGDKKGCWEGITIRVRS